MTIEAIHGHKVPMCDGKWIDVGTLTNPRDQMCVKCRGHRQKPLVEPQSEEYEMEEYEEPPRYSRGMQMIGYMLIAAVVSAAVTLLVIASWKGAL